MCAYILLAVRAARKRLLSLSQPGIKDHINRPNYSVIAILNRVMVYSSLSKRHFSLRLPEKPGLLTDFAVCSSVGLENKQKLFNSVLKQ